MEEFNFDDLAKSFVSILEKATDIVKDAAEKSDKDSKKFEDATIKSWSFLNKEFEDYLKKTGKTVGDSISALYTEFTKFQKEWANKHFGSVEDIVNSNPSEIKVDGTTSIIFDYGKADIAIAQEDGPVIEHVGFDRKTFEKIVKAVEDHYKEENSPCKIMYHITDPLKSLTITNSQDIIGDDLELYRVCKSRKEALSIVKQYGENPDIRWKVWMYKVVMINGFPSIMTQNDRPENAKVVCYTDSADEALNFLSTKVSK